ncbi:hypothetical protein HDZ31DRAFT_28160, partial [Schizophyllum fasciatum]
QVKDTLYRFHAYHLQRSTTYFDERLEVTPLPPQGSGRDVIDQAIPLTDVQPHDFEALLWFFYKSGCSWQGMARSAPDDTWKAVLVLAEKYSMREIAKVACYALHRAQAPLGDIRKICLCVKYNLPSEWMVKQIKRVLAREAPLSTEECRQLGYEMTALLAQYREQLRHSKANRSCATSGSCEQCQKARARERVTQQNTVSPDVNCFHGVHICSGDPTHYCECPASVPRSPFVKPICDGLPHSDGKPVKSAQISQVEDVVLRVHSHVLATASSVFADMLACPSPHLGEGKFPSHPIVLAGETVERFQHMLWFFYDSPYQWSEAVNRELVPRWESVLAFATKYAMNDVSKVAACALGHHGALSDARTVSLCVAHDIDKTWSRGAFDAICDREQCLTTEEADELGTTLTIQIANAREARLKQLIPKSYVISVLLRCVIY